MQKSKSALVRALCLPLLAVSWLGCADDARPDWAEEAERDAALDDDGGLLDPAMDAEPGTEDGPDDLDCDGLCGLGQACDDSVSPARCVGSCAEISCASGRVCEVIDDVGACHALCDDACGDGQRCDGDQDPPACVDNTCDFLACGASEVCVPAETGPGFRCADNTCSDDVDCESSAACVTGVCLADVCAPGVQTCDAGAVRECASNGSGTFERVACVTTPGIESTCLAEGSDQAACSCRDDWDCPAHTECVGARCEGTGRAPSCFLPPLPFASLLPQAKPGFPWGGNDADGYNPDRTLKHLTPRSRDVPTSPFPRHSQASTTPIVINLDDDNGDGRIDELDSPEIVFTAFCDTNYFNHGVLRALHGGGTRAGGDYFAVCEEQLWREGDAVGSVSCDCGDGDIEPTGGVAAGDLDGDGRPEIVVVSHDQAAGANDVANTRVDIFASDGRRISRNTLGTIVGNNPAVALADVDHAGFSEVVVGATLLFLKHDTDGALVVDRVLRGGDTIGRNTQGPVSCIANVAGDARLEIIAGSTVYRVPVAPTEPCPADLSALTGDAAAYCGGVLPTVWTNHVDGFCAVADVLGALPDAGGSEVAPGPAHPLDGLPEVVLVSAGNLLIYDGATGVLRHSRLLDGTYRDGGAPNIDDFDGDGFPEIGTAFAEFYTVVDLQTESAACPAWPAVLDGMPDADPAHTPSSNPARTPPTLGCVTDADCGDAQFVCGEAGQCVCLHNGWKSRTKDASSRVTGSSVFDFNGDGAAEVVYNDECYFRIYDGSTGEVYQRLDSQSPTRIEYPVVADVDGDGNAEVVFSGSNARSESCTHHDRSTFVNGINVVGEPEDRWISARRIWNQHAYHITNVLESGSVPANEVPNYARYGGQSYNTYRSNLPPLGNVAPDLVVAKVQVSSPGVTCGEALSQDLRVVARVRNEGDLRVGGDVVVRFFDQDDAVLAEAPLLGALAPGAETYIGAMLHVSGTLPTKIVARVDADQVARECRENNNEAEVDVHTSELLPDLGVELGVTDNACPERGFRVRVNNTSAQGASDVLVRLYAGNPAVGGRPVAETRIASVPAQGVSTWTSLSVDVGNRDVTIFAVVDPDDAIAECNDGNNTAAWTVPCRIILR